VRRTGHVGHTAQLTSLLDLDCGTRAPGRDEQFDVNRFGEWLEVLVETGDSVQHAPSPPSTRTS